MSLDTREIGMRAHSVAGFVAGPENALVQTLASVVVCPVLAYNPIVLCGPVGVGKSLLAHGLAGLRAEGHAAASCIATTGADLARGLAHAIETDAVADFRTRHLRCDLLLVDDVQQLAGKGPAQQFLLSALDSLVRRGSLVLATLRESPQHTATLAATLRSRLSAGLVVPIALPGFAARKEIVRHVATRLGLPLSEELLATLVGTPDHPAPGFSTPAQLQHGVLQLGAACQAGDAAAKAAASRLRLQESPDVKSVCRRVTQLVAKYAGLTASELKSPARSQAIAEARSLAMYVLRRITGASYAEIGRCFGDRDHTTVLYACRKMTAAIANDDLLRRTAEGFVSQIAAGS